MPRKKSAKAQEQESITEYAKAIETALLECCTNGQADVWRQKNFHLGFFGVFSIDQIHAILEPHRKNPPLVRAILAGIISVCVQELLIDQ
jgi:hypothetical protein